MIFLIELSLQIFNTIGICTVIYIIAQKPITIFEVIVWTTTATIGRIGFYVYDYLKLVKKEKNINEQKRDKEENHD